MAKVLSVGHAPLISERELGGAVAWATILTAWGLGGLAGGVSAVDWGGSNALLPAARLRPRRPGRRPGRGARPAPRVFRRHALPRRRHRGSPGRERVAPARSPEGRAPGRRAGRGDRDSLSAE
jgi:hypothetical protein